MVTNKFSSSKFEVYVSYTVNMFVTDIIVNITSREHFIFTYCISVWDYPNSSVKVYV